MCEKKRHKKETWRPTLWAVRQVINTPYIKNTYSVLMSLQLDKRAFSEISSHIGECLWSSLVVTVMCSKSAHKLLSSPLPMLWGQPRGEAAGCQGISQLQRAYSRRIIGRMGIQLGNKTCLNKTMKWCPGESWWWWTNKNGLTHFFYKLVLFKQLVY